MIVGRGCGENERVDFLRVGAGLFEQLLHGFACHIARAETFLVENASLLDADACHNPLIVGLDHARKFVVAQHIFRHVTAYARYNCVNAFHCSVG